MSDSLGTFILKTGKMVDELERLPNRTVNAAALLVKTSVTAEMAAAGAANGRLRGVGKKGQKIGVRYTVTGNRAFVRATGPFHLLESDTKAHRIPRERGQRARKRVVVIPGVGVRAFAQHPGTKGKHPWEKGVVGATGLAATATITAVRQTLVKAYG